MEQASGLPSNPSFCLLGKGSLIVASNFRISINREKDSFQVTLASDFDGTSACELLNVLKDKCDGANRVIICTAGLKKVYPFGQDTFRNHLYTLNGKRFQLRFTGKHARQIAPETRLFRR